MPPSARKIAPTETKGAAYKAPAPAPSLGSSIQKLSLKKVAPVDPSNQPITAVLEPLPGKKVVVPITLDSSGQTTIKWVEPITLPVSINGKPAVLPPGSANLYKYPRVQFEHVRKGKEVIPPVEQQFVLEELVQRLVLSDDEASSIAERRDSAGATPMLGLLVSNTKAALTCALEIYRAKPLLIAQCHTPFIFTGENALHILSVNRREPELCEIIELAASRLKPSMLKEIFWKQANGVFFKEEPMSYYGSTPISYAVAFSLTEALRTMLRCTKQYRQMNAIIDFNDPIKCACKLTGMLPIHVAVANSLTSMINFLVDLPGFSMDYDDMRARPDLLSQYGQRTTLSRLLPLQVAAKLGDQKLVQYILRTQSKQQWVWGPVSCYNLDLKGIDSTGDTGSDVMEICARLDASEETQEMLLPNFMAGLLHELFEEKFKKSRYLHYVMRLLDLAYILCIYVLAIWLRQDPAAVLNPSNTILIVLPYLSAGCIVPMLWEDLRVSIVWWSNTRGVASEDQESKRTLKEAGLAARVSLWARDIHMLFRWMQSHNMFLKMVGWVCCITACAMLTNFRSWPVDDPRWPSAFLTTRDRLDILLIPLSLASFFHCLAFFSALLFPFEKIGIFYKTCFKMLSSDVKNWIMLFFIFLLNYGMVMFIAYPRYVPEVSEMLPFVDPTAWSAAMALTEPVPSFLQFTTASQGLIELSLIGERVEYDLTTGVNQHDGTTRGTMKMALFILFSLFYVYYVIMTLVLLLNLLIAMMGDTYSSAQSQATREFRVNFARGVLRLELQLIAASKLGWIELSCGKKVGTGADAIYVYEYRNYTPNAEGGGTRGARASMFDEEVEKEADEDAADDDGPGAGEHVDVNNVTIQQLAPGQMPAASKAPPVQGVALNKMKSIGKKIINIAPLTARGSKGDVNVEDLSEDI